MTIFWILTSVMIVSAILFIAIPLLRKDRSFRSDRNQNQNDQNVLIAKEALAELKNSYDAGLINQEEFDQSKCELEQILINDLNNKERIPPKDILSKPWMLTVSSLLVGFLTIGIYFQLGSPDLIDSAKANIDTADSSQPLPTLDEMVETLSRRLQAYPEDKQAWYYLGRTYLALNDFDNAVTALEKLNNLASHDPSILITLADATAMKNGGILKGRPTELIREATTLAPEDPTVLWFAGKAEEEAENYDLAIEYWGLLKSMLTDDAEAIQRVSEMIESVKRKQGLGDISADNGKSTLPNKASIELTVSVDKPLKKSIDPNATLFVYAKTINGPKMPLAAVRLSAAVLPATVTLDDSMAVTPTMKLSSQSNVMVGALLTQSGVANGIPGDLRGEVFPVAVNEEGSTQLVINTVIQ